MIRNRILFYIFFSIICLQVVASLSFGLVQKVNCFLQQSFPGEDGKLIEMTILDTEYDKFRVNAHEVVINEVYFDIKDAVSLDNGQVKLVLKQDKFETFLVFTSGLLKTTSGKKEQKISDFKLPEPMVGLGISFTYLSEFSEKENGLFPFQDIILKGFHILPTQPPELFT